MTTRLKLVPRLALIAVVAGLAAGSAWADKPEWAGQGKGGKSHKEDRDDRHEGKPAAGAPAAGKRHGFDDDSRRLVSDYYVPRFKGGKCPPGLAKKHNGCLPPGQAKKWAMGQPVPADLRVYELPRELRVQLPPPPPEHRYVRVASDILMIAVGTGMVVDAIEDIGRVTRK